MLPVLFALQLASSPPGECVDPATSLRHLATLYVSAEQLAAAGSNRMAAAFKAYLASGSRNDYRTTQVRYEATGTGRYDHAARALVLGLVYASGPDLNPLGSAGYRHRLIEHDAKAANIALRHLTEAAELDSTNWLAPVALAHLALAGREPSTMAAAFTALRRTLRQPESPVVVRTALADLYIATDSAANAAVLLDAHTDACPGAEAAFGEALLLMGDTTRGAPLLLGALAHSPPDQLDRFLEDVAILLRPGERAALAKVPADQRASWIRDFWERSAAASARSLAQRLAEHVQRTARAHRQFRMQTIRTSSRAVAVPRGASEISLAAAGDPGATPEGLEDVAAGLALPWDGRGLVYVRHGQPDTIVSTLVGTPSYLPQNQTWVFARDDPPWMAHFGRYQGPDWFFLGPWVGCGDAQFPVLGRPSNGDALAIPRGVNPANAPGATAARARQTITNSGDAGALYARDYYLELARFDVRYDELASFCASRATGQRDPRQIRSELTTLAQDYGDVVNDMLTSESARRRLSRPLRLLAAAYTFRNQGGAPEVASFAWVPAADVAQLDADAELELSFSLLGTSGRPMRLDTTALVRNAFRQGDAALRVAVPWPTLPPTGEVRLDVFVGDHRDPERGGYAEQRVAPIGAGSKAISSVVIAVPDAVGPLVRGDYRIAPEPGHVVTVGEGFRLFYELYGIERDEELETTVRIRRTREDDLEGVLARYSGKRAERELRFREPAVPDSRGVVVRDVAISGDLVPGEYAVDVRVRTSKGELNGSTALRIREP